MTTAQIIPSTSGKFQFVYSQQLGAGSAIIKSQRIRENLAGSSGSGSSGDTNRVYTLTNSNDLEIVEVYLDGLLLVEASQYSVNNATKEVTVIVNVFDGQTLSVFFMV